MMKAAMRFPKCVAAVDTVHLHEDETVCASGKILVDDSFKKGD
jgi:hypothetical protein